MATYGSQLRLWEVKSEPPKPQKSMRDYIIEAGPFKGTYGSVCIGVHKIMRNRVAIKQLHPHIKSKVIQQEAEKLKKVKSPYVVQIYEFWIKEKAIVMEYCPFGLDSYLIKRFKEEEGIPFEEARELLQCILQGLIDAHSSDIIHGDIKPANVRFGIGDTEKDVGDPKLGDFGAARSLEQAGQTIPGSNNWMAPELIGGGTATRSSDYFSFAVLAYLILSGKHPFYSDDPSCLTSEEDNIKNADFKIFDLASLRSDVPSHIADLIMELLSRNPEQRESIAENLKVALSERFALTKESTITAPSPILGLSNEEKEQLKKVYDQANRYFFRNYLAPLALETLDEFLEKIKWERFKNQRIATLADCWSLKAFINNNRREFSQAIDSASNGLLIDPDHINSLHCRAHANTQSGNYDKAKIDVTKALSLCSDENKERQLKNLLATIDDRLRKHKSIKHQKEIAMIPLQPSL